MGAFLLPIPHPPSRLERRHHVVLGTHAIARQTTHAMRAAADSLELHRRHAAAVTADAARVAHVVLVAEYALGRREVKGCECA